MPGPKMGPRPLDFDESLVREAPTFIKWTKLQPGETLSYACRRFEKGAANDEERLMRRIMIARRNKRGAIPPGKKKNADDGAEDAEQQSGAGEGMRSDPPAIECPPSPSNPSGTKRRRVAGTAQPTDEEVPMEMDVPAVEATRSSLSPNPGGGGDGGSSASVGYAAIRALRTGVDALPRPRIPPGHASPVFDLRPHDVLSGRGGRINSHPGNVRFREMVDRHKREYLDPRTKKAEKTRIAARIVSDVRDAYPAGRFLKQDPRTRLWAEIGDDRAWRKASQALRESAPEIRAERQIWAEIGGDRAWKEASRALREGAPEIRAEGQMRMEIGDDRARKKAGQAPRESAVEIRARRQKQSQQPAGVGPGPGESVCGGGSSVVDSTATGGGGDDGGGKGGGRRSRQADPPGPRHRPNPPQWEGLARSNNLSRNNHDNNFDELSPRRQNQMNNQTGGMPSMLDEDMELARMRREYLQMQRLQQEEQKMLQYQSQLQRAQRQQGGIWI